LSYGRIRVSGRGCQAGTLGLALALEAMLPLSKNVPQSDRAVGRGFSVLLAQRREPQARPAVMGIVNVTPDSFSDGGRFLSVDTAVAQAGKLADEGAEILDVGGESTRKDAKPIPADEEMRRVLPVIEALRGGTVLISADTMKAKVAEAAIDAGAHIINDVRGLQGDPDMAHVVAQYGAGIVVMHNPGIVGSAAPLAGDPVALCAAFFERSLEIAREAGIAEDRIVLDPGFGFGKSPEQNLQLLARLPELVSLGFPMLVGTSRKSFVGAVTGETEPDRRSIGTLVTNVAAALAGAAILRVHDVAEHVEAMIMVAAIRAAGLAGPQSGQGT